MELKRVKIISIKHRERQIYRKRKTFCFAYLSLCEAASPFPADRALCLTTVPLPTVCSLPVEMVANPDAPVCLQHAGPSSVISSTRSYVPTSDCYRTGISTEDGWSFYRNEIRLYLIHIRKVLVQFSARRLPILIDILDIFPSSSGKNLG